MLLILPIILSRISYNFHPLFFIYSHATTYYSILFLKFDCVTHKIAYGAQLINVTVSAKTGLVRTWQ